MSGVGTTEHDLCHFAIPRKIRYLGTRAGKCAANCKYDRHRNGCRRPSSWRSGRPRSAICALMGQRAASDFGDRTTVNEDASAPDLQFHGQVVLRRRSMRPRFRYKKIRPPGRRRISVRSSGLHGPTTVEAGRRSMPYVVSRPGFPDRTYRRQPPRSVSSCRCRH